MWKYDDIIRYLKRLGKSLKNEEEEDRGKKV